MEGGHGEYVWNQGTTQNYFSTSQTSDFIHDKSDLQESFWSSLYKPPK